MRSARPSEFNPTATDTKPGMIRRGTAAEVAAGLKKDVAVTPYTLAQMAATTSQAGVLQTATDTETLAGTSTAVASTPSNLAARDAAQKRATYLQFKGNPVSCAKGGGASAGTATATNALTYNGVYMECYNIGTQTIIDPSYVSGGGWNIAKDQTNAEGAEYTLGIAAGSKHAYTIGTDGPFRIEGKLTAADGSGAAALLIGFRKAAAYAADYNDYTDAAAIGLVGSSDPAKIQMITILNNAATTTTDSTDTLADGVARYFRVDVSAAGVVTFAHGATIATLAAPTATVAFTFDSTDVVVPFVHFLNGSDVAGDVTLDELFVGLTADYPALVKV